VIAGSLESATLTVSDVTEASTALKTSSRSSLSASILPFRLVPAMAALMSASRSLIR
jgi:hypothetical protein